MASDDIITAIEPGETSIRVVVARRQGDSLRLLTYAEQQSEGIQRGRVHDVEAAATAIYRAVRAVERDLGVPLDSAVLCVPAAAVLAQHGHGTVEPSGAGRRVTSRDGERALARVQSHLAEGRRELLHLLPTHYTLDDVIYDEFPADISGNNLTAFACTLSGETAAIQGLKEATNLAGIEETALLAAPLASGAGALTEGERKLGVILLEIGARTSTLSLVQHGQLMDVTTIPIGGHHLTNDLAIGLSISYEAAESLKVEQGTVILDLGPAEMIVPCPDGTDVTVSRVHAISLLRDRAKEILIIARQRLALAGYDDIPPGGIVLTGRSAHLNGMAHLAREILEAPVRIGVPRGMEGIPNAIENAPWVTPIGALIWASTSPLPPQSRGVTGKMSSHAFNPKRLARAALGLFLSRGGKNNAYEVTDEATTVPTTERTPAAVGHTGSHGRER
jgi:cell division protein FtsA